MESERGMSPTMSLVIGIIIGSFTAMILIVIIVLKVRTGVDISEIKQVKLQRSFLDFSFELFMNDFFRKRCKDINLLVLQLLKKTTFLVNMIVLPALV